MSGSFFLVVIWAAVSSPTAAINIYYSRVVARFLPGLFHLTAERWSGILGLVKANFRKEVHMEIQELLGAILVVLLVGGGVTVGRAALYRLARGRRKGER